MPREIIMHEYPRTRLAAYGVALLAPVVTLLSVRWPLRSVLGDRVLYMPFFPAVLIAAYFGGIGPGLLATSLSALVATYFLVEPLYSLEITSVPDAIALTLFVLVGAVISGLSESLHRARRRIVAIERRRAEEALRESEARFRVAFENAAVGISHTAIDGRRLRVNQKLCDLLGYTREELLEQTWMDTTHPEDRAADLALADGLVRGERPSDSLEKRFIRKDGTIFWATVTRSIQRDAEGRPDYFITFLQDISKSKRLEQDLIQAHARLELAVLGSNITLLELNMPDGVLENSRLETISAGNPLAGYFRSELPTDFASTMALVHADDRERVLRALRAHLSGQTRECEAEYRVQRKDGSYDWRLARGVAVRDAEGRAIRCMISVVDITELKRAEEALRTSEQRFRTFVDHATDALFLLDDRLVVLDSNCQACRSLGYTRDELIGMTPFEFDPDLTPAMMEDLDRRGDAGDEVAFESRHRRKDGTTFPVEIRGRWFREGSRRFVVSLARDITERKRLEAELRRAKDRLDLAIRASNVGIWEVDMPDGVYVNGTGTWINVWEQLGLEPPGEDRPFVTWLDYMHPEDKDRLLRALYAYLDGETKDYQIEYRIRHKDGIYRWMLARGTAIRDPAGKPIRLVGSRVDITELKRVEEVLRESEAWFRFLANAMPQIVWTARPDGYCDYLNHRCEEYTGIPVAEMLGAGWLSSVHPDDRDGAAASWMANVEAGRDHDIEFRLRGTDGRYRWFMTRGLPVRDESGQIVKWLGTCTDIDEQRRAEEAERRAKEAAEAASRAKSEFLANVSHEIRTPMNAILGMTELALDTPLTREQREYLAIVKSSADALLQVINDLLDFSKIEAGKLELDHADFSLRHVLGETLRALALRAHRKGLELACRIPPEVPDALIGDAGRLRQVLLNLIGNAIKFTEQGEVVVRVEAGVESTSSEPDPSVPGSPPSQVLHFAISDTGIGIPREKQGKIFQAFEQGDNATTRRYEGTGLGLSIAARLVALMGGQITVESEPGRGSTFRFTAEFGSEPTPPGGPYERPLVDLHGLRVLVVDDNATNRQILEEWLRGWHTEPMAVADGFMALDVLWSAVSLARPFALVLLDARMPGTDGLAVARSIRQNPVLSHCRIILLTSEDLHGDIARYRELGIAAYAMKPVQQDELLEIIYRVLSRPDSADGAADPMGLIAAADSTTATEAPSARRLRVLVAEDNPFNQQLVERLLRRTGHDVRVASDGREALAALEQDRFDMMLLDVHMPVCDGFQVIEALRQRERATGGHLPVIALTARATRSDRERCLRAGMDEYLAKPIAAAELVRVMERVMAGAPAAGPEPSARGRPETLLDSATLLAACDDAPTLLRELIQVFQADTPGVLARIRDAVDQRDASRLREAAHELRGLISTFSAMAAAQTARLETMGASDQLDDAASTLDGLSEMVERLGPLLEELSIEQLRHQTAGGGIA
jgi:two-component system, sensor histidine kinase and response regulator